MLSMNERENPKVKKLIAEWVEEVKKLEPLETDGNVLDNSLNQKRLEIERKYKALIAEAIKHS